MQAFEHAPKKCGCSLAITSQIFPRGGEGVTGAEGVYMYMVLRQTPGHAREETAEAQEISQNLDDGMGRYAELTALV